MMVTVTNRKGFFEVSGLSDPHRGPNRSLREAFVCQIFTCISKRDMHKFSKIKSCSHKYRVNQDLNGILMKFTEFEDGVLHHKDF